MARCKRCPSTRYHEKRHQKTTTLKFNDLGGWSKTITRQKDGRFHCLCGQYQSRTPVEVRDHARTCQNVPESQQPSSRRSQRVAHRSTVSPYPSRSHSSPKHSTKQVGIPSSQASGSGSPLPQQQQTGTPSTEEAVSYDGDGELSSQSSYQEEIVPTSPLHTPPRQAPPLTEEAQAQVARIREWLVELITSNYLTEEDLPEDDVVVRFNVRLAGIRTPALCATLDISPHGMDVDTLARMIYNIVDHVPEGTLQNLRIQYPSYCSIL
ncbi:hypothetical protein LRAMOSA03338 [Lichtheimia ramosa]|uniref:Uncharacterized protein n=1 Tax=Lichtheimia ramosa TaxID=688394 RepID=A0A077WUY9_9FUNG|nr:hypothetical protein LRAMOSA03338 [Lichtheimia ramosa]